MSKVLSFRVNDDLYNYFKNLGKPFSESIPPILSDYINKTKNKRCIHPVYSQKNFFKYEDINTKVDMLIKAEN